MVQIVPTAHKTPREKVLNALRTRAFRKNKIISFPEVRRVLSWYQYGKEERDELLYELQEEGLIRIIPFHGLILEDVERGTSCRENQSVMRVGARA